MKISKTFLFISFALVLILLCLVLVIVQSFVNKDNPSDIPNGNHSVKPDIIVKSDIKEDSNDNPINLATQTNLSLTVSPTLELDDLIKSYEEEIIKESEKELAFALEMKKLEKSKKKGDTLWNSENWMKDIDYYKSLKTSDLVEECFERPIFHFELGLFEDPQLGVERLRMFHNGFQVLFQRDDMWEGIIHTYEYLSSKLNNESDPKTIIKVSRNLAALGKLYGISEFKEQIRGREEVFLAANMKVLKQFSSYIDNFDPIKVGRKKPSFFAEPCIVAQVAMMLAKQINPQRYNSIESKITEIRLPEEQNIQDVKQFINLVIESLEGFIPAD